VTGKQILYKFFLKESWVTGNRSMMIQREKIKFQKHQISLGSLKVKFTFAAAKNGRVHRSVESRV